MGHDSPPKQIQENSDTSEKNTVTKMTNTITEPICQICKIRMEINKIDEACLIFGGNNIFTIAAPSEFLDFKNWSYDLLFSLGHYLKKITFMKSTSSTDTNREIPYELPLEHGISHLPGSRKAHENIVFKEVLKTVNNNFKIIYRKELL